MLERKKINSLYGMNIHLLLFTYFTISVVVVCLIRDSSEHQRIYYVHIFFGLMFCEMKEEKKGCIRNNVSTHKELCIVFDKNVFYLYV